MVAVFEKIVASGKKANGAKLDAAEARDWYRSEALKIKKVNTQQLIKEITSEDGPSFNKLINWSIGRMFLFNYDPKTENKLPYFDAYPLVFPFSVVKGGFYGLNLHYLPPPLRAKMMDAFLSIQTNESYDDTTKLRLTYNVLKSTSRMKYFKPCVKHYLYSQLRSKLILVPADKWDMALMLPLQQFQKASEARIWADSRKMIT